ncbi:Hypothetical predicted protein [Octopus vulgaris]|uniref:Radial spoke head protein 6 homolog A n=1 Tax=Octopus vulgaris TaxID=6645 RepID=A0AA36FA08_OCTVU|nr:Hypothetical predicted protein [Octopus vulgaris]
MSQEHLEATDELLEEELVEEDPEVGIEDVKEPGAEEGEEDEEDVDIGAEDVLLYNEDLPETRPNLIDPINAMLNTNLPGSISSSRGSRIFAEQTYLTGKEEQDLRNAKAFLLTASTKTGENLYDHLCDVLTEIISERHIDAVDSFEDISKDIKKYRFQPIKDTLQDMADPSLEMALAKIETKLLVKIDDELDEREEEVESPLPNVMETAFYFEQGGIGIGREELFRVWIAMKHLVDSNPVQQVRFWGKILGTEQNYYVVETEYREGDQAEEEEDDEGEPEVVEAPKEAAEEVEDEEAVMEERVPKIDYKPPPIIPKEEKGSGTNKKTYFVCNEPGKPWIRLPLVTPIQIVIARQIKKYFTGRLDAPIITYPPFPGNEMNYLRTQIARISAGTQASMMGFYQFDEEEEEEEEGEVRDTYIENIDFDGLTMRELCESLSNWVHHTLHILPQGRCKWFNATAKTEEEVEEDEEEEREEMEEPQPEIGPPLLTPLSEDISLSGIIPWTLSASSSIIPQYAVAVLQSNLWPGAYTFSTSRRFENIYIGWGHKAAAENYTPPLIPAPMDEYLDGPEVIEIDDPTPEQEAALRAEQQANAAAEEELEEEEEEEEEEA